MLTFVKRKVDGLEGTEVHFTAGAFTVVASRKGMWFTGKTETITHLADLQEFAGIVDKAFKEHRKLLPKIISPAEGLQQ